jgi:hypothetical protein
MSNALRQQGAQEKSHSGCVVTVVFPERVSPQPFLIAMRDGHGVLLPEEMHQP